MADKPTAPASSLVAVYDVATGEEILRYAVDARELVASGGYTYDSLAVFDAVAEAKDDVKDEHLAGDAAGEALEAAPAKPRKARS